MDPAEMARQVVEYQKNAALKGDVKSPYYKEYRELGLTPDSEYNPKNLKPILKKFYKVSTANRLAIEYIDSVENPSEDLLVVREILTLKD